MPTAEPTPADIDARSTPPADVALDVDGVRALLVEQHPDLAALPVVEVESGWDNAMFRLGDALAVRLPRRKVAAPFTANELRFLPEIARRATLPVPAPVRVGRPGAGYPWSWSVVPWLDGTPGDLAPPDADQATVLADFLRSIHVEPPPDAPRNASRGVPLREREVSIEPRLRRLEAATDAVTPAIRAAWRDGGAAPIDVDPTWIHGDLHARNVLVRDGALVAVVDWGDLTAGDPATDLASVWMLLPTLASRQRALELYAPSEATLRRARGWAVLFAAVLLDTGRVDEPRHAAMGATTFARIAEGP